MIDHARAPVRMPPEAVEERLRSAARELRALMPITFTSVAGEIKEETRALLKTNREGV